MKNKKIIFFFFWTWPNEWTQFFLCIFYRCTFGWFTEQRAGESTTTIESNLCRTKWICQFWLWFITIKAITAIGKFIKYFFINSEIMTNNRNLFRICSQHRFSHPRRINKCVKFWMNKAHRQHLNILRAQQITKHKMVMQAIYRNWIHCYKI